MRYFELLIMTISIVSLGYYLLTAHKRKNKLWIAGIILLVLSILHYFIEGMRWQMTAFYGYTLYLCGTQLIQNLKHETFFRKSVSLGQRIFMGGGILLLLLSVALVLVFPVNTINEPIGDYAIGTMSFDLVDDNRLEIYNSKLNEQRKIRVQLWYPSDSPKGGTRMPWLNDGIEVVRSVASYSKVPSFVLDHTQLIQSHSYENLSLSSKMASYPMVIISHGWSGFRNLHTDLAEMLASRGYVVVSIDHTFGSLATVFNDGETAKIDYNALPDRDTTLNFLEYANALVNTYSGDDLLVLDTLEQLNAGDNDYTGNLFTGKLDLNHIGVLGHSTGGGGVVQLAIKDERIKAVFGMDAWVEPVEAELLQKGLTIPSLFLRSEQWEVGYNNANLQLLYEQSKVQPLVYQINGSKHLDFTMLYMYQPLIGFTGFLGELDGKKDALIQQTYALEFFDTCLKGEKTDFETLERRFNEVEQVKF